MIFVTSDTHFYHRNIITYDNLDFATVQDMNEEIINNWNEVVKPDDEVYHLGDAFFCSKDEAKEIMDRLNGHKHLIVGNHDRHGAQWFYDIGFETVSKHPIVMDGYVKLSHYPPEYTSISQPYYYIYGHIHNSPDYLTINRRSACVCSSRWEFRPVPYEALLESISEYDKWCEKYTDLAGEQAFLQMKALTFEH